MKSALLGAIGGKILGAGGGGFMLLFAHPSKHKSIVEELKPYVHVPFQFEKMDPRLRYISLVDCEPIS